MLAFPTSFCVMRDLFFYIGFPLGIFVVHYLFLWLVMDLSAREKKGIVALLNMVLYPLGMSGLLSSFFVIVARLDLSHFMSSVVVGVAGYYLSMVLAFVPFLDLLFRELDMEFLLLGLGSILGVLYSSPMDFFKSLGGLLTKYTFSLLLVFVVALVASTLVKYLISKNLIVDNERKEVLKNLAWVVSISTGVVSVPLIVFFLSLGIAS